MSDQGDNMHKAIRLAGGYFAGSKNKTADQMSLDDIGQCLYDALATQLVRQACDDAIDFLALMQKVARRRLETGDDFSVCTIDVILELKLLEEPCKT